jgi:lipopolysaccharide/colanic/teichoic acid biosynthesis glycosyltransferase
VLRKLSIDEMPQFANVVMGQMSLVGPRPALPYEVRRYSRSAARRLSVKPGITCIWQVSGRSNIPFKSWVAMDRIYISRRSLLLDLGLLIRTPWAVVSMKGAW